jgi:chromosome segregation ATPase
LYSCEKYRENIRLFYNEQYSFPGNSPAKPRSIDEMLTRARQAIAGLKEREEARDASIAHLRKGINARDASIAQLREDTKTLGPLREGIEARDASIAQLRQEIETRDASIAQLREGIETRDGNIAQLREGIEARDASIEDLRQSASWKLTAPLRLIIHLFRLGITTAERALSELSALRK